jgi:hypothetical protein
VYPDLLLPPMALGTRDHDPPPLLGPRAVLLAGGKGLSLLGRLNRRVAHSGCVSVSVCACPLVWMYFW